MTSARPVIDLLVTGAAEVVTCAGTPADPLGRVSGGVVAIAGERIAAVGTRAEVEAVCDARGARVLDVAGDLVAPGFVDCHTHVVFGGSRAAEYAAATSGRLEEFRRAHELTGILATVALTRSAGLQELFESAADRRAADVRARHDDRREQVRIRPDDAARAVHARGQPPARSRVADRRRQHVPRGARRSRGHDADRYTELLVREMIPAVGERRLAEFCDVYCDDGYFDVAQSRRILEAGLAAGLAPKIHADAYSRTGGAELAVALGAISIDHLNHTSKAEMRALAEGGVVGVVMPALDYAVAHPRPFDARAMAEAGMTLALATDLCPGCWVESQQLVMAMAARSLRVLERRGLPRGDRGRGAGARPGPRPGLAGARASSRTSRSSPRDRSTTSSTGSASTRCGR